MPLAREEGRISTGKTINKKLLQNYHLRGKIKLLIESSSYYSQNKFRDIKDLNIKNRHRRKIYNNMFMTLRGEEAFLNKTTQNIKSL